MGCIEPFKDEEQLMKKLWKLSENRKHVFRGYSFNPNSGANNDKDDTRLLKQNRMHLIILIV